MRDMPFAAITYDIKPGHEDEIAEIFADFQRVAATEVDAPGQEDTRILSTALFIRDGLMVRMIEYEGDLDAVARRMFTHPAVRRVEERLANYVNRPRDTDTEEGFVRTFNSSLLRSISQLSVRDQAVAR